MRTQRRRGKWGPIPRTPSYWADVVRPQWLSSLRRHKIHPTVRRLVLRWLDQTQPGTVTSGITVDYAWKTIQAADKVYREEHAQHPVH